MIGHALGDQREAAGLTQAAAAKHLGMSQSTMAEIETGHTTLPVDVALRMVKLYGRSLADLDVTDKQPSYAIVRRSRGRPRLPLRDSLTVPGRSDDAIMESRFMIGEADELIRRGDFEQAQVRFGQALWAMIAPHAVERRARNVDEILDVMADEDIVQDWPDLVRGCVLLFWIVGYGQGPVSERILRLGLDALDEVLA